MENDALYRMIQFMCLKNLDLLAGKVVDYMVRVMNPVNTFASTYNNWALMFDPGRYYFNGR